jgi:hypothetical protein
MKNGSINESVGLDLNALPNIDGRTSVFDDVDSLRLSSDTANVVDVLTHVAVRKPRPAEFFRVRADERYRLVTSIYLDGPMKDIYFVRQSFAPISRILTDRH